MDSDVEVLEDNEAIEASNEVLASVSKNKTKHTEHDNLIKENIKVLIKKFIFIVLLFFILFYFIFGFTRIPDISMSPNIAAGDLLLYYRLDKNYQIGDVVTFKMDDKRYVLRIIALEGQVITLNTEDEFLIDGEIEYHKTYFENSFPNGSRVSYPYRVPKNKVFVVGDYRTNSNDSRLFGAIDVNSIDGKVISLIQTKDI